MSPSPSTAPPASAHAETPQGLGVTLQHASVTFPPTAGGPPLPAVNNVSLDIPPGQFVALLGPSGCGKSTLLRAVAGLQSLTSGTLTLTRPSRPLNPSTGRDVAFVFQDPNLLPWRSVLRNVALPLELMGVPRAQRLAAATDALTQVGLADALHRYPAQLSGGMRMRASLARALVTSPRLLLLDEPFAALDEITRFRLDEMLRELWISRGMTVLFVTHSIPEAVFLSQRAIVFTRRPARLLLDHPIDLPLRRDAVLRTDVSFARQARALHESLVTAEAYPDLALPTAAGGPP